MADKLGANRNTPLTLHPGWGPMPRCLKADGVDDEHFSAPLQTCRHFCCGLSKRSPFAQLASRPCQIYRPCRSCLRPPGLLSNFSTNPWISSRTTWLTSLQFSVPLTEVSPIAGSRFEWLKFPNTAGSQGLFRPDDLPSSMAAFAGRTNSCGDLGTIKYMCLYTCMPTYLCIDKLIMYVSYTYVFKCL